jgi:hypothetical protein
MGGGRAGRGLAPIGRFRLRPEVGELLSEREEAEPAAARFRLPAAGGRGGGGSGGASPQDLHPDLQPHPSPKTIKFVKRTTGPQLCGDGVPALTALPPPLTPIAPRALAAPELPRPSPPLSSPVTIPAPPCLFTIFIRTSFPEPNRRGTQYGRRGKQPTTDFAQCRKLC